MREQIYSQPWIGAKGLLVLLFVILSGFTHAQIEHRGELWQGYIHSYRLNKQWSVWNDFHFVNNAFWANRHGFTYHWGENTAVTAGYAWVTTATPFSSRLERSEHRPWGQIETRVPLNTRWTLRARFRYDARFRQALGQGEVLPERVFHQRYRFMGGIRYKIKRTDKGYVWHLNVFDELLLQSGPGLDLLDQNRVYFLPGVTKDRFTLMGGYHHRAFPMRGNQAARINHGFALWIVHVMGWKA